MRLTDIERFLDQLGDEARAIAMQHFRTKFDVETKSDATPVTNTDRAIERRLREMIASRYPTHVLVGEEEGGRIGDGVNWVIDPIDGTKSFATGVPLLGTLVPLLERSTPHLRHGRLVEGPAMRERWIGLAYRASCNGDRARTHDCARRIRRCFQAELHEHSRRLRAKPTGPPVLEPISPYWTRRSGLPVKRKFVKESNDFASRMRTTRIGIGTSWIASGPSVTQSMHKPLLADRKPIFVVEDAACIGVAVLRFRRVS